MKNKDCYAIPRSISVDRIRIEIGDTDYEWSGGFGAVLVSFERNIMAGSTRMIVGVLFHVAYVHRREWWRAPRVCWTIPNDAITAEWIRAFKSALLGIETWTSVTREP